MFFVPDLLGYAMKGKVDRKRTLELVEHIEMDVLILLGPFLRHEMEGILLAPLERLRKKALGLLL